MVPARGREWSSLRSEIEGLAERHLWAELRERLASYGDVELSDDPRIAYHLAEALVHLGAAGRARVLGEAAEAKFRERRDERNLLRALNIVGAALFELGDLAGADERFSWLLELAAEAGDEEMRARASHNLGAIASLRGEHEKALSLYRLSIPAYQRLGRARGLAQTEHNMAILYRDQGRWEESDRHYQRAIEQARRIQDARLAAMAAAGRAEIAYLRGDLEASAAGALRALEDLVTIGDALGQADALRLLGVLAREMGDRAEARRRLDAALFIARANGNRLLEAEILRERGHLSRDEGRRTQAADDWAAAAQIFRRLGAKGEEWKTQELLETPDGRGR